MPETQLFNAVQKPGLNEKNEIAAFLYTHLGKYGDSKEDILKAIDFSVKETASFGGFTLVYRTGDTIAGVVVVNQTGMEGYIPENVLVYIATHPDFRAMEIGTALMNEAIQLTKGDIAVHVEPDNPVRHLYHRLGFKNKYLEMRLTKTAL